VTCEGDTFPVQVWEEAGSVHAIATTGILVDNNILSGMEYLESEEAVDCDLPGKAVRALAIRELSQRLGIASEELSICQSGRIPTLLHNGEPTDIDLSLSHHGRLIAFACEVPALER